MSASRLTAALALLIIAFVAYRTLNTVSDRTERHGYDEAASGNPSTETAELSGAVSDRAGPSERVSPGDQDCLTREASAEHPMVRQVFQTMTGLAPTGADIDAFRGVERAEYQPRNVYHRAVLDIAPQLEAVFFEEPLIGDQRAGQLAGIRSGIAGEFKRTLDESGMPSIAVSIESAELEALRSRLCSED